MWYVVEVYFRALNTLHRLEMEPGVGQIDDINAFTATPPELSKEQAGYSVHVLIAQVCMLIAAREFEAATKRMEYLRLYISQYLKASKDSPIRWFAARLNDLTKARFDIDRMKHPKGRYEPLLRSATASNAPEEFQEIVPLDVLVDAIVSHLVRA